jgi:hypothetical protein
LPVERWKKPAYHSPRNRTDAPTFAEIEIDLSNLWFGWKANILSITTDPRLR